MVGWMDGSCSGMDGYEGAGTQGRGCGGGGGASGKGPPQLRFSTQGGRDDQSTVTVPPFLEESVPSPLPSPSSRVPSPFSSSGASPSSSSSSSTRSGSPTRPNTRAPSARKDEHGDDSGRDAAEHSPDRRATDSDTYGYVSYIDVTPHDLPHSPPLPSGPLSLNDGDADQEQSDHDEITPAVPSKPTRIRNGPSTSDGAIHTNGRSHLGEDNGHHEDDNWRNAGGYKLSVAGGAGSSRNGKGLSRVLSWPWSVSSPTLTAIELEPTGGTSGLSPRSNGIDGTRVTAGRSSQTRFREDLAP
jgi:hypothetical protein